MKHLSLYIVLALIAGSCNDSSEVRSYEEAREEFLKGEPSGPFSMETEVLVWDDVPVLDSLSSEKEQHFIEEELAAYKSTGVTGLGPSGMAVLRDSSGAVVRKCGTTDLSSAEVVKMYTTKKLFFPNALKRRFKVPVRWYVIDSMEGRTHVWDSLIEAQVDILNKAFAPIAIEFYTDLVDRHTSPDWSKALQGSNEYNTMVDSISYEPKEAINIFVTNQDSLFGSALMPWDENYLTVDDHILLDQDTFPGKYLDGQYDGKNIDS